MKKLSIIIVSLLFAAGAMAQTSSKKVEVLYFKANLSCCQAKTCNNLENVSRDIVAKNFSADEVAFKTVALANEANKSLVNKYKAKSQSLIIVNNKKKKHFNMSNALAKYARDKDKAAFEKELIVKIKQLQ